MLEFKDYAFIGYWGYGEYSNSTGLCGIICKKEDLEKLSKNIRKEWYFGDLDGKHSEVKGDFFTTIEPNDFVKNIWDYGIDGNGINYGIELFVNKTFESEKEFKEKKLELSELNKKFGRMKIEKVTKFKMTSGDETVIL